MKTEEGRNRTVGIVLVVLGTVALFGTIASAEKLQDAAVELTSTPTAAAGSPTTAPIGAAGALTTTPTAAATVSAATPAAAPETSDGTSTSLHAMHWSFLNASAILAPATEKLQEAGVAATPPPTTEGPAPLNATEWTWLNATLILGIAAVCLLLFGTQYLNKSQSSSSAGFRTSLLGSSLQAFGIGALVMIVITLLTTVGDGARDTTWANEIAVGLGIVVTVVFALFYRELSRNRNTPEGVNPWQYAELRTRLTDLDASLGGLCKGSQALDEDSTSSTVASEQQFAIACEVARTHAKSMKDELGLHPRNGLDPDIRSADKWLLGSGFVEQWVRLHAAEAALYSLRSPAELVAGGNYDRKRIAGSGLADRDSELLAAIGNVASADQQQRDDAKQTLVSVRMSLNDVRDQSRAGIARTRVQLILTGIVTAVVAYILLALAIFHGASREQVIAGVAFFLVGAVTGLFSQLNAMQSEMEVSSKANEDDFGLAAARLVYTPVLSGLAAVGGVLLMAMLSPALNVVIQPGDQRVGTVPTFEEIFSLESNRFGLVVAAIFGLTPTLLINRLSQQADRYKVELQQTSALSGSAPPSPPSSTGLAGLGGDGPAKPPNDNSDGIG